MIALPAQRLPRDQWWAGSRAAAAQAGLRPPEPAPEIQTGGGSTRGVRSGLAQDDSGYLVFRLAQDGGDRPALEDLGRDLHPDVLARARDVTEWDWGMLWEVPPPQPERD